MTFPMVYNIFSVKIAYFFWQGISILVFPHLQIPVWSQTLTHIDAGLYCCKHHPCIH
eukprot:UN10274